MLISRRILTGVDWRTAILLLLMAALLVPVIVPSGFFFPYVVPRNIFFRAICETAVLILAWALCFGGDELDLRYEPIFWALIAFIAATLLSALLSPASNHSLFGDFERMGGVWSWVHLALFFLLLDVLEDSVQIVIESGSVGVANPANFLDKRIVHGLDSRSSSGVQIIGALNPLATQTASIKGRIVALAKCRQFHVNR